MALLQNISLATPVQIARHLMEGSVGAIAMGRAEVGPRALGNRSIVATAAIPHVRDRINGLIKNRSAFQPLAPVCLRDDIERYFILPPSWISLDHMTCALQARELCKEVAPGIVHADGTARVLAIDSETSPFLASVLLSLRERTGHGILINTSFNGRNQPIVNNAEDAYAAYRSLDLDFLVISRFFVSSRI